MSVRETILQDLVAANRILAREEVVDGYGHVSVRHPDNPERFFLSRSRSPELVVRNDIMEFDLACQPIDQQGRSMYAERPIHGAIYAARPDVMAVIHNHAHEVIPYSVTKTHLRPIAHAAATMGPDVPVWDIRERFGQGTNLLVTTLDQGRDLARCLGDGRAALLRGHGCVVVGKTIRQAVMSAIYMMVNAKLLTTSLMLGDPIYLTDEEIEAHNSVAFSPISLDRTWEYWCRRAAITQAEN
jgi:ribulose-5-phosphate 4-epimerase/fuculose-1-phosphate aldolase